MIVRPVLRRFNCGKEKTGRRVVSSPETVSRVAVIRRSSAPAIAFLSAIAPGLLELGRDDPAHETDHRARAHAPGHEGKNGHEHGSDIGFLEMNRRPRARSKKSQAA